MTLIVFAMSLAVISANAQSNFGYRAHIPFDFTVGKTTFKAGDYKFSLANHENNAGAILITDLNNRSAKVFMSTPGDEISRNEISKLVFNRYDNQYFLSKMMTATVAADFTKPKTESQLAKKQKAQNETVAMNNQR